MPTVRRLVVAVLLAVLCLCGTARAQGAGEAHDSDFSLGFRFDVVGADGEPTNDMLGASVAGRYRLNDRWWLGMAFDHSPEFDSERPYESLGLVGAASAGEVDALATANAVTAWIERVYARPGRLEWFWGLGGGLAVVDVEDVAGPLEGGGGTYDISQDVGTELLAGASGGLRVRLGARWAFETALRLDQHFTDWTITDRVSGRTVKLDDYLVKGGHFGLVFRF